MSNLIKINNGNLVVSSREVAENFGKEHKNVILAIREHIEDLNKVGSSKVSHQMFMESVYENRGKTYPEFLMNRDGFSLLVMSFNNTRDVLSWKLKYIEAFNKMEDKLKEQKPAIDSQFLYQLAGQLEEKEKQIALQGQIIGELKPKADYTDRILKNKGLVTITQISKDYGLTGQEMNKLLHKLKVQYKQSDQWLLYRDHQGKGYTHSETIDIVRSNGLADIKMNTKWTQKG